MTDILDKWAKAAPKVSSQALAQLYSSGKGKDPRGQQMLAIFKKRKDPKIGPKGKPGPTYTTVVFVDPTTKIRFWPKTKFPPKKDAAGKDASGAEGGGDAAGVGGGAPMEELFPETPDAEYSLLQWFQYTLKEWGTVNADIKPGDVIYVRGLQYKLYRESIGKPIQFSVQGIVEAYPNETLSTVLRRSIRDKSAFMVKRTNDTHIPEMQKILGPDWRNANTDGKDWIPQQNFFIHVDQSIDPAAAITAAELANEPYMFAKIPEEPYDESFFVYPVTEKNLTEQAVFSGLGGTTPLAYQIAQGTTREDGTLIQAQFTLWPESLNKVYSPSLKVWAAHGMNFAKGIVFDMFGKDNETRSAALPVNNMGTLDSQIVLRGKAIIDLAATIKNMGIPISIDTAADIFDKSEIGELFRTKRRILGTTGDWEGTLKNLTRHEFAMNLNIVNGYVTRLINEVEKGNVALYAVVNTIHTPESRSSEKEGRKFLEPLLAQAEGFIGCVYAVSKKEPIRDLFVGGASGGVSSTTLPVGAQAAIKTFLAPVTDKSIQELPIVASAVTAKPKAVAKPAEEDGGADSDSDVVPPPAKKQKKEEVKAVAEEEEEEEEEEAKPKKEKTKKEKSKKSKKDKKSKKSKKRKTDSSDEDDSSESESESSEESSDEEDTE